jgi:hypothetical protein
MAQPPQESPDLRPANRPPAAFILLSESFHADALATHTVIYGYVLRQPIDHGPTFSPVLRALTGLQSGGVRKLLMIRATYFRGSWIKWGPSTKVKSVSEP